MADNTILNAGTGGDTVRDVQKGGGSGPKTQVVLLDMGGAGAESLLAAGQALMAASLPVTIASNQSAVPVSISAALPAGTNVLGHIVVDTMPALAAGTNVIGHVIVDSGSVAVSNFPATQPVSAASLPLPTGAASAANQATANTSLASIDGKLTACDTAHVAITSALPAGTNVLGHVVVDSGTVGVSGTVTVDSELTTADLDTGAGTDTRAVVGLVYAASGGAVLVSAANPLPVTGSVSVSNLPATQAVSAASLPLPSGASTSAKQAAPGAAGSASSDVLTIQGIASMTAVKVDGSATTQPISGTVTANAGTGTFGVSGTVTANIGTTNGLALDATLTGGTARAGIVAATSGGATPYHYVAAGSANQDSQVIKSSAGQVYGIQAGNNAASVRFLKLYNKATAPTSSDTPVKTLLLPPGGGNNPAVSAAGLAFSAGIAHRITTGLADNDTGAATASDVSVEIDYK